MAFLATIGSVIGPYEVTSELGRGGMAQVVLARDSRLGRTVALKLLSSDLAEDADFRARFLREAKVAAALEHPNVVPVYDAGDFEGILFIAMRYIAGTDLRRLLEAGPLEPPRALGILGQVADGLDAAHAAGLVHRDVKPANVLIGEPGSSGVEHAYLADFGLAWQAVPTSVQTKAGTIMGTTDYMAPEQVLGRPVDARADVYALGCVLYECLTGTPPFRRDSAVAAAVAHLREPPPRLSDTNPGLSPALDGVVARALAKAREDRYPTSRALIEAAVAALEGTVSPAEFVPSRSQDLPLPLTSLVGREAEVTELMRLINRVRLVTLVGTGGAGKTRLAIEVARRAAADGRRTAYVDLATVEPESAAVFIRSAVQRSAPDLAFESDLGSGGSLVIVDDCERHVDRIRETVTEILGTHPDLVIVATSREPLRVAGEQAFPVRPLEPPEEGSADVLASPAGKLLWDRVHAANPNVEASPSVLQAVGTICRVLDGIPLALELAASRAAGMSLEELARRIEGHPALLTNPAAEERRRTIDATIDWSHDLLDERDRTLFRRLACFADPFDLADAEVVCGFGAVPADAVAESLPRLVERSLVVLRGDAGRAAYRLLGPIARFAAERLAESGEEGQVRARHARRSFERLLARREDLSEATTGRVADAWQAIRWLQDSSEVDDSSLRGLGGRAAVALAAWDEAVGLLDGTPVSDDPDVLEALGVALCKVAAQGDPAFRRGQTCLERAFDHGHQPETLAALAGTYKGVDDARARDLYARAVDLDPADPYALGNLLEYEIEEVGSIAVVDSRRDQIERALARCSADVDAGRNLPWARFDQAKFSALLGEQQEALDAYLLAARESVSEHPIESSRRSVERLAAVASGEGLFGAIEQMLQLVLVARFSHSPSRRALVRHCTPCAASLLHPVLVLAGDSSIPSDGSMREHLGPLHLALQGFGGTILSGGTTVGVSALAGDLAADLGVQAIGYSPANVPGDATVDVDPARYLEVRRTDGSEFGIDEPLRYWTDILLSRIVPTQVCVLGIGGGVVSSFEYRLALALGAWVGLLRESGRGAGALLADPEWVTSSRLFELTADPAGLRAFLRRGGIVQGEIPEEAHPVSASRERSTDRRTFLFTDIEGSTSLIEAIGDEAWQELRDWHDRTLRSSFAEHGGEEVDNAGDGFFVTFPTVDAAVACAVAIQRTLETHRREAGFAPRVRVGIHEAEAIGEAGRWFGKGVHVAARIGSAARGGQILASASTVMGANEVRTSDSQAMSLKGLQDQIDVVSVDWR